MTGGIIFLRTLNNHQLPYIVVIRKIYNSILFESTPEEAQRAAPITTCPDCFNRVTMDFPKKPVDPVTRIFNIKNLAILPFNKYGRNSGHFLVKSNFLLCTRAQRKPLDNIFPSNPPHR